MSTLVLRLAGPLQSWGDSSRFTRRSTRHEPTKSGVLGLIAAAQGRRRTDPIEDLVDLRFGVRIDQPGRLTRDFQTARSLDGKETMPLSYRYYLADAVFLAALEGADNLIDGIADALRSPTFPLYLGRRSCPPASPLLVGVRAASLVDTLRAEPWQAALWYRRQQSKTVGLPVIRDAVNAAERGQTVRDQPLSFSPERREYSWRTVIHDNPVSIDNPDGRHSDHDPFALLGGA